VIVQRQEKRTVFILGAGATRGAIKHVLVNQKRIKPPLNSDFFSVAKVYARAMGSASIEARRVASLKRVFKEEVPIKGSPNMEDAFSLLYVAKDFPEIYKTGPGKKPAAGNRKEIEDFLRLTIDILTTIDRKAVGVTGYDRLVGQLGNNDAIISLNYDTLLDSALVRQGWSPRRGYRLGGGKSKVEWGPVDGAVRLANSPIPLLKLHGSLNWFVRGSYSSLSKIFSSKPVRVSAPRQNEIGNHMRQIVPPIYGKIFEHGHWRRLWTDAFEQLSKADLLVVIGCSLVETDFHLRALLSRVIKFRKQNNALFKRAIFVADTKTRHKWQKALKGSYSKTTGYPTFESFLRKELGA
jgi:hypothetical protein